MTQKNWQEIEEITLASYAVKSADSKGRKHQEAIEDGRAPFQRDRDRIIHCKAFRRLDEKTQVLGSNTGDHYRTRLTHTLEVAQVSRDLARRLALNEDLCESIALAHDLGHAPFGHAGEDALDEVMKEFNLSFEHNEQSRRVVEILSTVYPNFPGLNLTYEVIEGMMKHQTAYDQEGKKFEKAAHLEAQVVNLADEIAYVNHDIDDGLRAGVITIDQLKQLPLWQQAEIEVVEKYGTKLLRKIYISRTISTVMSLMLNDLVVQTAANLKKEGIKTVEDVVNYKGALARFSEEMRIMVKELRTFLYQEFYMSSIVMKPVVEGKKIIQTLFNFYYKNPGKFPRPEFFEDNRPKEVVIKDYIAGMTDPYIRTQYEKHCG
jgi:dGTPase